MSSFQDGQVDIDNTPLPVTGTITTVPSGTQDVRVVSDTDGLAKDATVAALTKPSDTQIVDGSAHTQPVSGTVTTIPSGTQSVSVTNFPVTQPVSGTVTVQQLIGSSLHTDVDNFPATQPVSGTVSVSGTVPVSLATAPTTTVVQPTGANLHVVVDTAPTTPVTGTFFQSTQPVSESNTDKSFGTWSYYGGISGTITVAAGQRVLSISCHSSSGGSLTINSGMSIPVPANVGFAINPLGNLIAPTIVYTGTDSYFIETVS